MAKATRTIKADHRHLTGYFKNHFKGRNMPGAVLVNNIVETVVNDVEIFATWGIATALEMPRHCLIISHNGTSEITVCDTDAFTGRWVKSAKPKETEKYLDSLLAAYTPDSADETPLTESFYSEIKNSDPAIPLYRTIAANHTHLTDYLYYSIRYAPEMLPVGEVFDFEINDIKISARIFSYDINRIPMDFMVISNGGYSTVYFLSRFGPIKYSFQSFSMQGAREFFGNMPTAIDPVNMTDAYTRAIVYINRYNPAATKGKNNYYIK